MTSLVIIVIFGLLMPLPTDQQMSTSVVQTSFMESVIWLQKCGVLY